MKAIMRNLIWSGSDNYQNAAMVNWEQVCLPKKGGGLGLKYLPQRNKAAILKHLWALCKIADMLWAKLN